MSEEQVQTYTCTRCIKKTPLKDLSELKKGDHISTFGRRSRCNFGLCKWSPYSHHVIVSEILSQDGTSGKISVIGFEDCENELCPHILEGFKTCRCPKGLRPSEKTIDINLKASSYQIITYGDEKTADEGGRKVEEAKEMMNRYPGYKVCLSNCEHFCNEVCTGVPDSRQIKRLFKLPVMIYIACLELALPFAMSLFSLKDFSLKDREIINFGASTMLCVVFLFYKLIPYCVPLMPTFSICVSDKVNIKQLLSKSYKCQTCRELDITECIFCAPLLAFYTWISWNILPLNAIFKVFLFFLIITL